MERQKLIIQLLKENRISDDEALILLDESIEKFYYPFEPVPSPFFGGWEVTC